MPLPSDVVERIACLGRRCTVRLLSRSHCLGDDCVVPILTRTYLCCQSVSVSSSMSSEAAAASGDRPAASPDSMPRSLFPVETGEEVRHSTAFCVSIRHRPKNISEDREHVHVNLVSDSNQTQLVTPGELCAHKCDQSRPPDCDKKIVCENHARVGASLASSARPRSKAQRLGNECAHSGLKCVLLCRDFIDVHHTTARRKPSSANPSTSAFGIISYTLAALAGSTAVCSDVCSTHACVQRPLSTRSTGEHAMFHTHHLRLPTIPYSSE